MKKRFMSKKIGQNKPTLCDSVFKKKDGASIIQQNQQQRSPSSKQSAIVYDIDAISVMHRMIEKQNKRKIKKRT